MTWNNIGNGNTSTAAQVNQNFQHIIGWSYSPMAGTLMANTSGVHNLGSTNFRWSDLYSKKIFCSGNIYMTSGATITLNSKPYRGGMFYQNAYAGTTIGSKDFFACFAATYETTINPTSGWITMTANIGLDTRFTSGTGNGYIIYQMMGFRKESGTCYYSSNDHFYYDHTTSCKIYAAFDCSTFTSANTQTVLIYYEYVKR